MTLSKEKKMLGAFIAGVLTVLIIVLICGSVFGVMLAFWFLAQHDLFYTPNIEGTGRVILHNGKFHRCIGALQGHKFQDATGGGGENSWEVVEDRASSPDTGTTPENWRRRAALAVKEKLRIIFGLYLLDGLEWVGIPPFYSVYTYPFKWSVLKSGKKGEKVPETKEEVLSYIFLKQVVYLVTITSAETIESAPMDASLVLTMQVVNPYKALFAIHNWLEAISDQVAATMRAVIGKHTFKQLTEARETASKELEKDFADRKKAVEDEYGVKIHIIQMQAIDPTEEVAKKIRDASLEGYVAEQKAVAIRTLAAAEKDRIAAVYGTVISYEEDGLQIRWAEALERTGVSVIGGGILPSFQIPSPGTHHPKTLAGT